MKKLALLTSIFALMLMVVPQVSAVEINIDQDGVMSFYQDGVLGKNSDNDEVPTTKTQPIKTVSPTSAQQLNVKYDNDQVEVELAKPGSPSDDFTSSDKMGVNRLDLSMPSQMDDQKIEAFNQANQQERSEMGEMQGELQQERDQYQQQLLEQRKERQEEMVQLKSQLKNNAQNFEISSREIKASVKDGAQFTVDPVSGLIVVTTPSGQEHTLYHLPDQAVDKMLEAGVIASKQDADSLEVTTAKDGSLVYTTQAEKTKKFFGLFPWQKRTQVSLDDSTGEVTQQELPPSSLFEQMLDLMSN